ncbi:glutathione S-transferase kappa 1 [Exaiptasia diaphana]|uniref:Glutathione S-transferase kappa n=1 Tax=Exaiptasia diaphana TaxID=2652724 RepID=A0A913Y572_EXADI|nr:glutathione S-transferase kappa 1 [Exaiptasia diaphana]KXJ22591.1 Glutathione S-transferase kappa 1 [Exaiptasia diaphana]
MAVAKRTVELFYDVLSPYSWVAFEVLCRYRPVWHLDLRFRPFFLGGVMNSSGNRPPAMVPAKGAYMAKDLKRLREFYGVPLQQPKDFADVMLNKGSLSAMRLLVATSISHPDMLEHVSRQFWLRVWSRDEDIVLPESLKMACLASGLNETQTTALLSRISDQDIKEKLKENTKEALDAGSFGAPTIIAHHNDEKHMFFGSDRFLLLAHLFGVNWEGPLRPPQSNL